MRLRPPPGVYPCSVMKPMGTLDSVVHGDPEILGGTPVFRGTRVPVKNILDYLVAGDTLASFSTTSPR